MKKYLIYNKGKNMLDISGYESVRLVYDIPGANPTEEKVFKLFLENYNNPDADIALTLERDIVENKEYIPISEFVKQALNIYKDFKKFLTDDNLRTMEWSDLK